MIWLTLALAQEAPQPAVLAVPSTTVKIVTASSDEVAFRLSLAPGIGIGAAPNAHVHGIAMGLASHAAALEGVDGELVYSWVDGTMEGIQMSTAFNVAGDVHGVQGAVAGNWARGEVNMAQLSSGFNVAEGRLRGVQATAGINVAMNGMDGAQLSSGVNILSGDDASGVQAAAGLNIAESLDGLQAAPLNIAGTVDGAQLGILNVGGDVKGLQLGLVNVARTSDVSIAPLNFIGDGLHRVDVWASESSVGNIGLKLGSKQVYTLLGAGWVGLDQDWWTFGGGFGVHLTHQRLWFEIDDSVWSILRGVELAHGLHNKLRVQAGVAVHEHFQPFVGVSMNHWIGTGRVWPQSDELPARLSPDRRIAAWPGIHAGVSF